MKHKLETILGIGGPAAGLVADASTLEVWLRVASLSVGLLVGVLSAYSLWLKIKRDKNKTTKETDDEG